MERGSFLSRSSASSRTSSPTTTKGETMLPLPVQSSPKLAVRALLGHCFYRRVFLWAITATIVLCLMIFSGGVRTSHGRILDHLVDFGKVGSTGPGNGDAGPAVITTPGIEADGDQIVSYSGIDSTSDGNIISDTDNSSKDFDVDTFDDQQAYNSDEGPHWLKFTQ